MRRLIISSLLMMAFLISTGAAGELGQVELIDGSVICGEIVSSEGGIYTLKTSTLGTVRIEESSIRAIRFETPGNAKGKENAFRRPAPEAQVHALQQLMMGDPEIIRMLLTLLNDPDVQGLLQDPSIIEAVNAGDIEALTSNQKFMKLLENPTIQDITGKIAQ
ncbi:MAG TPA: hypothetical protein VMW89_03680 [Desulfatiglandales bacterium]|nr:hypothetical protein [Desulfatiglandales bacterium]